MRLINLALSFAAAAMVAGCSASAPTAPDATPGPASGLSTSATISGAVQSPGAPGVVVKATGSDRSATIDAAGRFTLVGVPAGTDELRFTSGAMDAGLTIEPVRAGQAIEVNLAINGSTVTLSSEHRTSGTEAEVEGTLDALPAAPGGALMVAGRPVQTTATTEFRRDGAAASFSALAPGQRLRVKGHTSGGAIVAALVEIRAAASGGNDDLEVEVTGQVASVTGSASAFVFFVTGREFRGDAQTVFLDAPGFAGLVAGVTVEVKGVARAGFVQATRIHFEDGPADVQVRSRVASVTGSGSALTLRLADGSTVLTSSATVVRRRGDPVSSSLIVAGVTVEVEGTRRADGVILAAKVTLEDDGDDGAAAVLGRVNAISGLASAPTLVVGSTPVATDGATVVRRRGDVVPIGVLQVGMTVEVEFAGSASARVARKVTIESDSHDVDVEGAVTGTPSGGCPGRQFVIGATMFVTSSETEFKDTSCSALTAGLRLKVRGVRFADGRVAATRVERD